MALENRQNVTYQRQRYQSRERELEITPDTVEPEHAVEEVNIGEPRSKEEAAFDSLLKALNDLARR